jgi:ADP-heptose:LPS heptosyltransferase
VRRIEDCGAGLTVLVLRMGAFGDILRTLPAVRLARFALPDARIFWVVDERWKRTLEDHPDLDGCITLPRGAWRSLASSAVTWPALAASFGRTAREIRSLEADIALDFHGNLRSGVLGRISGARARLGYAGHQQKEGNRWFTTHRVPAGPRRRSRMERNLDLVRALGIPDRPLPDAGLPFTAPCLRSARELLSLLLPSRRRFAILVPGASRGQAYKKPPAELLAATTRALRARGLASLVVWGPGEEADASRVVEASDGAAVMAPPTDLPLLGAIVRLARLVVSTSPAAWGAPWWRSTGRRTRP